jgi:DNA-binding phage protein
MARRSADWNEGLAEDLRDPKFAQGFIQAALDEGIPIQVVLGKVIRAYGVKEFAEKVKLPSSNLIRVLSPKYNPTLDTLNRLLRPFALEVTVAPAGKRRVA